MICLCIYSKWSVYRWLSVCGLDFNCDCDTQKGNIFFFIRRNVSSANKNFNDNAIIRLVSTEANRKNNFKREKWKKKKKILEHIKIDVKENLDPENKKMCLLAPKALHTFIWQKNKPTNKQTMIIFCILKSRNFNN